MSTYRSIRPLFTDPPDHITEDDRTGFLIGGMASHPDNWSISHSYRRAAERLIEDALRQPDPHEIGYPVLLLYRHAMELALKCVTGDGKSAGHKLDVLVDRLCELTRTKLNREIPEPVKRVMLEFHQLDPRSTALRYVDGFAFLPGEYWVDLNSLREMMGIILDGLQNIDWRCRGQSSTPVT